jgi:hypothetical protein
MGVMNARRSGDHTHGGGLSSGSRGGGGSRPPSLPGSRAGSAGRRAGSLSSGLPPPELDAFDNIKVRLLHAFF